MHKHEEAHISIRDKDVRKNVNFFQFAILSESEDAYVFGFIFLEDL